MVHSYEIIGTNKLSLLMMWVCSICIMATLKVLGRQF